MMPIETDFQKATWSDPSLDTDEYKSAVGNHLYIATLTRPITTANRKWMYQPKRTELERISKYLSDTVNLDLHCQIGRP